MLLTEDQKDLLRMASSKMTPEDYSALEKEEQELHWRQQNLKRQGR